MINQKVMFVAGAVSLAVILFFVFASERTRAATAAAACASKHGLQFCADDRCVCLKRESVIQ